MNFYKILIIAVTLSVIVPISNSFAVTDPVYVNTYADLNYQIKKEIKEMINTPISLFYSDKNLNGTTYVMISVREDGKIFIDKVIGGNAILNSYLAKKLNSRNLWTDPKYAKSTFFYKIVMK